MNHYQLAQNPHARRSDALHNHVTILRTVRDTVAKTGDGFTIKDIASSSGVSVATIYRHFEGKQSMIDDVSIQRWKHMTSTVFSQSNDSALRGVATVLDTLSQLTCADAEFIHALGLRVGRDPSGLADLRTVFNPRFDELWTSAQSSGVIDKRTSAMDAIELAGSIRSYAHRRAMLQIILRGVVTSRVDVDALMSVTDSARV